MTFRVCGRLRETVFGTQPATESRSGAPLGVTIDAHLPASDAQAARIEARVVRIAPEAVTIDAR